MSAICTSSYPVKIWRAAKVGAQTAIPFENPRRRVGPQCAGHLSLRAHVEVTEARNATAVKVTGSVRMGQTVPQGLPPRVAGVPRSSLERSLRPAPALSSRSPSRRRAGRPSRASADWGHTSTSTRAETDMRLTTSRRSPEFFGQHTQTMLPDAPARCFSGAPTPQHFFAHAVRFLSW